MQNTSGPKVLTEYVLHLSKVKAEKSFLILMVQGILAGIYIPIGAIAYFKVVATTADSGIGAFLGAFVFPVGIIAVLIMHAELFTSDCMVMTAVYAGRTKLNKIFKILGLIFIANIIGCIFVAYLTNASGIFSESIMGYVIDVARKKAYMPFDKLFISGILCNIIVCTGVCLSYSSQNEVAKVIVLWLTISVFVLSGTEHVIANAYYLFTAYFAGAEISLMGIVYNLFVSGLGNFIGGGVIVSGINYILAYQNRTKANI